MSNDTSREQSESEIELSSPSSSISLSDSERKNESESHGYSNEFPIEEQKVSEVEQKDFPEESPSGRKSDEKRLSSQDSEKLSSNSTLSQTKSDSSNEKSEQDKDESQEKDEGDKEKVEDEEKKDEIKDKESKEEVQVESEEKNEEIKDKEEKKEEIKDKVEATKEVEKKEEQKKNKKDQEKEVITEEGIKLLIKYCDNADYEEIKELTKRYSIDYSYQDEEGKTYLHHYCNQPKDCIEIIKLITNKESTKIKDKKDKLALEYAIEQKLEMSIQVILEINDRADVKVCYDAGQINIEKPKGINRYGFFHSEDEEKSIIYDVKIQSNQKIKQEKNRNKKWKKMLEMWKETVPHKLNERVMKGVPMNYRRDLWKKLLEIDNIEEKILKEYKELNEKDNRSKHDKQIDLDINRTFQLHYNFKIRYCGGQKELFNVLHSLSETEPELGYVQGMSSVISVFTMFLKEEEAYAGAKKICEEKYKWKEMFLNFDLIQKLWKITGIIMKDHYPQMFDHLKKLEIIDCPMPFFIFEWHYLWYVHAFNFEISLRVFDFILMDGFCALMSVARTVMFYIQDEVLKIKTSEDLQQKLKTPLLLLPKEKRPTANMFMSTVEKKRFTQDQVNELLNQCTL
ncbi:glutamic acid-rich protein precursor, putative [Entamoeba dispar SAW760]|uniref:Glutamic acid-rich protein, putative n=1 Tax=Entamoeba dispar (strain ATCC PRA-260 / SAW760) TaxID=370354 RepID=B0EGA8_ENTDS|nr:glutamic acid-rich protein precursor, putative [Entamoeba dispar SAW760]EDR26434.1 glutamic acid-rich protein precursor, putative [Entamoeba dispar SAW760]|eukprot:EDR26434.1 glutamic acid-rich protein precursor, putative [Entamoeba dispar SAW760]